MTWLPVNKADHRCFGCGTQNPHGLNMNFETDGEKVRTVVTIPEHLRGWHTLAHGGVTSTILDEVMGWASMYFTNKYPLTRDLSVSFKKPIYIGQTVTATGWIKERKNARKFIIAGEIRDEAGELLATSASEFAMFDKAQFTKLGLVPEDELDSMTITFAESHEYGHSYNEASSND
jgi:acyl-coenzyme A thioesterase PaaI-like protein